MAPGSSQSLKRILSIAASHELGDEAASPLPARARDAVQVVLRRLEGAGYRRFDLVLALDRPPPSSTRAEIRP